MIKNLNDFLSFVVLIFVSLYTLKLLIYAYVKSMELDHDEDHTLSKWQLFKEYLDNTEE